MKTAYSIHENNLTSLYHLQQNCMLICSNSATLYRLFNNIMTTHNNITIHLWRRWRLYMYWWLMNFN